MIESGCPYRKGFAFRSHMFLGGNEWSHPIQLPDSRHTTEDTTADLGARTRVRKPHGSHGFRAEATGQATREGVSKEAGSRLGTIPQTACEPPLCMAPWHDHGGCIRKAAHVQARPGLAGTPAQLGRGSCDSSSIYPQRFQVEFYCGQLFRFRTFLL